MRLRLGPGIGTAHAPTSRCRQTVGGLMEVAAPAALPQYRRWLHLLFPRRLPSSMFSDRDGVTGNGG